MKVHNDLKELLEAHTKWVLKFQNLGIGQYKSDLDRTFLASNSLALGKQKPLAKNKQTQEVIDAFEKGYKQGFEHATSEGIKAAHKYQ